MSILAIITLIFVLSLLLIKSAEGVIISIRRLSKITKVGGFALAAIILALATSLPELFVGISSSLSNVSSLSLGNVVGANLANLSLIIGVAGLLGGVVHIKHEEFLNKELPLALLAGIIPIFLIWDRELSRIDGLILLIIYGLYTSGIFTKRFLEIGRAHQEERGTFGKFFREVEYDQGHIRHELLRFIVSIAVLLVSSQFIVKLALNLSSELNIPIFLVGLIIISLGTTLPELAFSFRSIRDKQPMLLLGNALGSVIVNATFILGIVALISPVAVSQRREYLLSTMTFVIVVVLFWLFTRTKHRLDRWEAGVLLLVYIIFVYLQVVGFNPYNLLS